MVAFHDSCHDRGHRRGSGKVLRVMEAERAACVSALRSPSPIPFPAGGQETTSVPEVASHRCASVYHLSLCPPQLRAMRRDWPPCCCTSRGPVSLGCPRPPCWHTCRMSSARQRAGTEQGGLTPGLLCLPQAPTSGAPQATAQDTRVVVAGRLGPPHLHAALKSGSPSSSSSPSRLRSPTFLSLSFFSVK